jgi:hypothetical protein
MKYTFYSQSSLSQVFNDFRGNLTGAGKFITIIKLRLQL